MKIKKIIRDNKYLYYFIKQIRKVQYYLIPVTNFHIKRYMRKKGLFKNESIEKMKNFKNKHTGQRCFIIATGPSLRVEDLEKLNNEITIGMNSISKIGEKSNWRPTYYGIQDFTVYKNIKESISELSKNIITFIPDSWPRKEVIKGKNIIQMPIYGKNHLINPNADNIEFSNDCYDVIHDGYTITYSLIQLAVYMGFKEIYLLGADCSYAKNGPQHFIETGVIDPNIKFATERMLRAYRIAKEYADRNNIKILNATRGGFLEVFERINFDDIKFQ